MGKSGIFLKRHEKLKKDIPDDVMSSENEDEAKSKEPAHSPWMVARPCCRTLPWTSRRARIFAFGHQIFFPARAFTVLSADCSKGII